MPPLKGQRLLAPELRQEAVQGHSRRSCPTFKLGHLLVDFPRDLQVPRQELEAEELEAGKHPITPV